MNVASELLDSYYHFYVYDDGVIKGFIRIQDDEVKKLFVEPVLQNQNIGSQLLDYAITYHDVSCLWALEKNIKAISFYEKHGFSWDGSERVSEFDGALEVQYVKA